MDRIDQFSKAGPFKPREILDRLIGKDESLVLDLGSGSGYWTLEAARLGARLVKAVDANPERAAWLGRKASELGLGNVHALQGMAERLPVDPTSCDVVVASLVLHEVNDLPGAIAEIRRVLRDRGALVVVELKPSGNSHHPRIDDEVLRGLLNRQGFEEEVFDEEGDWYCLIMRKGDLGRIDSSRYCHPL